MSGADADSERQIVRGSEIEGEFKRLLDAVVDWLSPGRRTFTEEEAFTAIWNAGYEVSPQIDPRFILASEVSRTHDRHWRLMSHTLANNRLLEALMAGAWDGRDLDAHLARLDTEEGGHHVFCPVDARFTTCSEGTWEAADRETEVALPPETAAQLGALGPALLERWRAAGGQPWTLRQITETVIGLGWSEGIHRSRWQFVRAWLNHWSPVIRVSLDYWVIADHVPRGPGRARLQVLPVAAPSAGSEAQPAEAGGSTHDVGAPDGEPPLAAGQLVPTAGQPIATIASWTTALRTVNLVEGFLHVPRQARGAYPPHTPGAGKWEVLRGKWFDTNEDLWIWLDREREALCGPDLVDKLAWCNAGDQLRIDWASDVLVLRLVGSDPEVQREETRLVDLKALAELRGGLGETYRRSLLGILADASEGLTFAEVVAAVRARQAHEVHRGTVRTLLHAGGFILRDGRWFTAPDPEAGARRLRSALVETLVPPEERERLPQPSEDATDFSRLRATARATQARLREILGALGGRPAR